MKRIINTSISRRCAKQNNCTTPKDFDNCLIEHFKLLPPFHIEMLKANNKLVVGAKLQDCQPEDIKLRLNSNRLSITARPKQTTIPDPDEEERSIKPQGIFRAIDLPFSVYLNNAVATYKEDLLVIQLKKAAPQQTITLAVCAERVV